MDFFAASTAVVGAFEFCELKATRSLGSTRLRAEAGNTFFPIRLLANRE
jgi:hypothetical protein